MTHSSCDQPKHGIDLVAQMQVICPATSGEIGTRQLNGMLQQVLNPPKPEKRELVWGGKTFRVGGSGHSAGQRLHERGLQW